MKASEELLIALNLCQGISGSYFDSRDISLDPLVNDCLIYMYFYMMSGDDKYYQKHSEIYNRLNSKQQEFVKNDYIKIINAQDENEKVKKKGEMKNE